MRVPITLDLHITAFNYPNVPPERLFEHLADMAKTAQDNGFGSVSVMDHLHQIPPMGPQELNMLEGNMALAGIAARTSKADLGLLVGGGGEQRTLRIAARHADMTHWFPIGLDALNHKTDLLRGYCEDIGRDPGEIERDRYAHGSARYSPRISEVRSRSGVT